MGSVGKSIEKGIGGIVGGVAGKGPKLGGGGQFALTEEAKAGEAETLKRLRERAAGTGPSLTQMQYDMASQDLARQAQSQAASARGVANPALLQRQAMQQTQEGQMQLGQQAAMARLAEQQSAEQAILGQAAAQRGVAAGAAANEAQMRMQDAASRRGFIGGLGASAASLFTPGAGQAASDENSKKDMKESSDATKVISEFMDALKSYTYEYKKNAKQPGEKPNPEGEVSGIKAQDLEKSELGKQMVTETKDGKVVDFAQGMAPLFASIAELNKRLKNIEKKG